MMNLSPTSVATPWQDEEQRSFEKLPLLPRPCSSDRPTADLKLSSASVTATTASSNNSSRSLSSSSKQHGNHIRSKYLAALGIAPPTRDSTKSRISLISQIPRSSRLIPRALSSSCNANVVSESDDDTSTCTSASSVSAHAPMESCLRMRTQGQQQQQQNGKKAVAFSTVTCQDIHMIPSRASLSPRTRRKLWITAEEMRRNYSRNVLEFRSENWDYRQCLEESSFLRSDCGELVHPVHFILQQQQLQYGHYQVPVPYGSPPQPSRASASKQQPVPADTQNLKQHFCRVMSAQKRW